jgi:DNA-binding NarL/FixJ family response regulator
MKSLLIHNDNFNYKLLNSFDWPDYLHFNIPNQSYLTPNFNLDSFIHSTLKKFFLDKKKYDLIVLPFSLDYENYMGFIGVSVAQHIRFTSEFNHWNTPILFLGEETPDQIAKISRADFLFTKGVFYSKIQTRDEIDFWLNKIEISQFEISDIEYDEIINKIILKPPNDVDSKHRIDNEFALLLWGQQLGISLPKLKTEIESGIYFKWWALKNRIEISILKDVNIEAIKEKNEKPFRVLLIDDDAEKGWFQFYEVLLPNAKVDYLNGNFKDPDNFHNGNDLMTSALRKIKLFDPHVVLIDLRLTDSDSTNIENLTGIEIIKQFRECKDGQFNQGIQFVSTSASNKIWHYQKLYNYGVKNFILKQVDTEIKIEESNKKFAEDIESNIIKADYLKSIYKSINSIKEKLKNSIKESEIDALTDKLDMSFELAQLGYDDSGKNKFVYHLLFMVLEGFTKSNVIFKVENSNHYVVSKNKSMIVRSVYKEANGDFKISQLDFNNVVPGAIKKFKVSTNTQKRNPHHLDIFYIVNSIIHLRLGFQPGDTIFKNWKTFNTKRNKRTSHGYIDKVQDIDVSEIQEFIVFLLKIFDNSNQNLKNQQFYEHDFQAEIAYKNVIAGNTIGDFLKKK